MCGRYLELFSRGELARFQFNETQLMKLLDLDTQMGHANSQPISPGSRESFSAGELRSRSRRGSRDNLTVIGTLPPEMDGMFVRNGPNPQFPPIKNYHWFEGDGMLHGVRIQGGRASYRNRYIRTPYWKSERAAGKSLYGSFLDPPSVAMLMRLMRNGLKRLPMIKNTANTALVCHDGRVLALWEGGEPHQIAVTEWIQFVLSHTTVN